MAILAGGALVFSTMASFAAVAQWTGVWPATPGAAPTERDLALLPPRSKPPGER